MSMYRLLVGRGRRISLPVSSQDMLNSASTLRVRDVMICGAITSLWIPNTNRSTAKKKIVTLAINNPAPKIETKLTKNRRRKGEYWMVPKGVHERDNRGAGIRKPVEGAQEGYQRHGTEQDCKKKTNEALTWSTRTRPPRLTPPSQRGRLQGSYHLGQASFESLQICSKKKDFQLKVAPPI